MIKSLQNQNIEDCPAPISDEMRLIQSGRLPTSHQGWGVSKVQQHQEVIN